MLPDHDHINTYIAKILIGFESILQVGNDLGEILINDRLINKSPIRMIDAKGSEATHERRMIFILDKKRNLKRLYILFQLLDNSTFQRKSFEIISEHKQ